MLSEQLIILGLCLLFVSTFIALIKNESGSKQEMTIYQSRIGSKGSRGFGFARRCLIAIIGFGATYGIQIGVMLALKNTLQIRVRPSELQWFTLPCIAAIAIWHFSSRMDFRSTISEMTVLQRLIAAIYASWTMLFFGYSILIKPRMWTYGYYGEVAAWLLLPPTVLTGVVLIFRWALRRRPPV